MVETEAPLQRWEIAASAIATFMVTLAAIVQEDTASLALTMRSLKVSSWWLSAVVAVPLPVWWVVTAAGGSGAVLARPATGQASRGAVSCSSPRPSCCCLQYAIPWLLYCADPRPDARIAKK